MSCKHQDYCFICGENNSEHDNIYWDCEIQQHTFILSELCKANKLVFITEFDIKNQEADA